MKSLTDLKRTVLLKGTSIALTTGLDWREKKIEYNAWRKLWREHAPRLPEAWKDFDTFLEGLPARPREAFHLDVTNTVELIIYDNLVWLE